MDGTKFSPSVTEQAVKAGGLAQSFSAASHLMGFLAGTTISFRPINNLTLQIGLDLKQARDTQTQQYQDRPLSEEPLRVSPPPPLACVQIDGGRIQTRTPNQGTGVHESHWRENKPLVFSR